MYRYEDCRAPTIHPCSAGSISLVRVVSIIRLIEKPAKISPLLKILLHQHASITRGAPIRTAWKNLVLHSVTRDTCTRRSHCYRDTSVTHKDQVYWFPICFWRKWHYIYTNTRFCCEKIYAHPASYIGTTALQKALPP